MTRAGSAPGDEVARTWLHGSSGLSGNHGGLQSPGGRPPLQFDLIVRRPHPRIAAA